MFDGGGTMAILCSPLFECGGPKLSVVGPSLSVMVLCLLSVRVSH